MRSCRDDKRDLIRFVADAFVATPQLSSPERFEAFREIKALLSADQPINALAATTRGAEPGQPAIGVPSVAPSERAQEPVAWRYRHRLLGGQGQPTPNWGTWRHVGHEPQGPESDIFQVEPLYPAPRSATRAPITATQIHDVYQEEFYRKDKTGKQLAHATHADLIKTVIHRLLGVEITEPWDGDAARARSQHRGASK
jgi:hypothetical protein